MSLGANMSVQNPYADLPGDLCSSSSESEEEDSEDEHQADSKYEEGHEENSKYEADMKAPEVPHFADRNVYTSVGHTHINADVSAAFWLLLGKRRLATAKPPSGNRHLESTFTRSLHAHTTTISRHVYLKMPSVWSLLLHNTWLRKPRFLGHTNEDMDRLFQKKTVLELQLPRAW